MRRKLSFVTNSSSTSYILTNTIAGKIKVKNLNFDLTEVFKNIIDSPLSIGGEILPFKISSYSDKNYLNADYCGDSEGSDYNYSQFRLAFNLDKSVDYDTENVVYLKLEMSYTTTLTYQDVDFLHEIPIELISRIVRKLSNRKCEFAYYKVPSDMSSGGWDGGDSMGSYDEIRRCLENELEIGTMSVTKGKVKVTSKKLKTKKNNRV